MAHGELPFFSFQGIKAVTGLYVVSLRMFLKALFRVVSHLYDTLRLEMFAKRSVKDNINLVLSSQTPFVSSCRGGN